MDGGLGNETLNHYDHVHIATDGGGYPTGHETYLHRVDDPNAAGLIAGQHHIGGTRTPTRHRAAIGAWSRIVRLFVLSSRSPGEANPPRLTDLRPDAEGGMACMNRRAPNTVARRIMAGCSSPSAREDQAKEHSVSEKTPDDIFKLVQDENIEYVDVRFCDLPGTMQHFTIPIYVFDKTVFEEGLAFDGSSIRGFQSIHESDMLLLPTRKPRPSTRSVPPERECELLRARPVHARVVLARPAQRRP